MYGYTTANFTRHSLLDHPNRSTSRYSRIHTDLGSQKCQGIDDQNGPKQDLVCAIL